MPSNPHAKQFSFRYVAEDPKASLDLAFRRRTDVMPPAPRVGRGVPGRGGLWYEGLSR